MSSIGNAFRLVFCGGCFQGPLGLSCWRLAAPQGDPVGFCGTVKEMLARRLALLFACQRCLQALCNTTLADVAHGMAVTAEGLSHMRIGPVGAIDIHLQQDMSMLALLGCGLPALGHVYKALSWLCRNAHLRPSEVCSPSMICGKQRGRRARALRFTGAPCPQATMLLGVRWSVAYPRSTRHGEALLLERGGHGAHAPSNRWGARIVHPWQRPSTAVSSRWGGVGAWTRPPSQGRARGGLSRAVAS
jgi:hypothetical protein